MDGWHDWLFQLDCGCGLTNCFPSLCMLCKYCWFSTACPINRLWGQRAGVQTVRQNIAKLSVTKTLCCHWRALWGYVWHFYNTIFKTIAGAAVLKLLSLSLWANTCDSRLTCITRYLYRAPRVAKLPLVCGMSYLNNKKRCLRYWRNIFCDGYSTHFCNNLQNHYLQMTSMLFSSLVPLQQL